MPRSSYCNSVKDRLRQVGKSQQELAKALHFTPSYISQILHGKYPAESVRRAIDEVLGRCERERNIQHGERKQR